METPGLKPKHLVRLVVALLALCAVAAMCFLNLSNTARAAAGDLDSTFGSGGKVTTDVFGGFDVANAIAVQADRKIVVAGSHFAATDPNGLAANFLLARYEPSGLIDPSFGGANVLGAVFTDFGGRDVARGIVVQTDGRIVVAGGSSGSFALARYSQDGSLDTSFGAGGQVLTTSFGEGYAIAIQPDGKLVVVGSGFNSATGNSDFVIARYNSDGSLDPTFDGDGTLSTDFGDTDGAFSVAIDFNNRIVVAGSARNALTGRNSFALARYLPDGAYDVSFGAGGKSVINVSTESVARTLVIQPPFGKIIAAGSYADSIGNKGMATVRFNPSGSVDSTFGYTVTGTPRNGVLLYPNRGEVRALALESDGIIAAGTGPFNAGTHFFLNRHDKDGRPDVFFSGAVDFDSFAEANALTIQPDGKLVAAGSATFAATLSDLALARYQGKGTPASTVVLNWGSPADIIYGQPLGASQLNATASVNGVSVPGTFTYTPGAGTVLNAGAGQTLSVSFIPEDASSYLETTGIVKINVLQRPLTIRANDAAKLLGAALPDFSVGYGGFAVGDDHQVLGGTLDFTTPATIDSVVGTYPITPGGVTSPNYAVSFVDGRLLISYKLCLLYDPSKTKKSGSTIPIKLQLCDTSGQNVSSAATALTALGISQSSSIASGVLEESAAADADKGFRYSQFDGTSGYIINLKTAGLATGTYNLMFKAGNDPVIHFAPFQVK